MIMKRNLILPVALVAALIGGSVGALVVRKQNTSTDLPATVASNAATTTPATYSDVSNTPSTDYVNASADQLAANNSLRFQTAQEQLAYREGFADGFLAARNATANNSLARASYAAPRTVVSGRRASSTSRRVYYDYGNQPRGRSFWQKHRDKLTVAMGTGGGALLGGLIGGKRGAGIGALAGAGGSALYTYKLRNRTRRY